MNNERAFEFVSELARDLNSGDIELPSFPEVVVRIRRILENENADFEAVSKAISSDAVLASRLLVFANSAMHNPAGVRIDSLDVAIGRLGFELIRNTAVALAMRQMFLAGQYKSIAAEIREIWQRGMQRAAMSHAIAVDQHNLNEETAFLCGLLHEVGALYILSKASTHGAFVGDRQGMLEVSQYWRPQIGKCIVEAWNFADEIVATLDPSATVRDDDDRRADYGDVVVMASILIARRPGNEELTLDKFEEASRLGIYDDSLVPLDARYMDKLTVVREALTG